MGIKKMIDIKAMENLFEENKELLMEGSYRSIENSQIGKAIKKKLIEAPALVYLYEVCENYSTREVIAENCGFSFQEMARSGLLPLLVKEGETRTLFLKSNSFFHSTEEFVSFVKELYNVDLNAELGTYSLNEIENFSLDFKAFGMALASYAGPQAMLYSTNPHSGDHRAFYLNSVEQMAKLSYYTKNKGVIDFQDNLIRGFVKDVWIMSYENIEYLLNKYIRTEDGKEEYLLRIAIRAFYSCSNNPATCVNKTDLIRLLQYLKDQMGMTFTYEDLNKTGRIKSREAYREFLNTIFTFLTESDSCVELTNEEREALYNIVLKDGLEGPQQIDYSKQIKGSYHINHFINGVFNTAPKDKYDFLFDRVSSMFPNTDIMDVLTRLGSGKNLRFYPTEKMTESMLSNNQRSCSWDNFMMPESWLYDVERISYVEARISENYQDRGILFGSSYGGNRFVTNRIDLDRVPAEVFIKFEKRIRWRCLSRCRDMSLNFMKKHKDSIYFGNLQNVNSKKIDEELADFLLTSEYDMTNRLEAIRKSKSLGDEFIAKHLDKICSCNGSRVLKVKSNNDITIADILSHL